VSTVVPVVPTVAATAERLGSWPVVVALVACGLAVLPAGARWLRVAQREHYLPGACSRFALRWWRSQPVNAALAVIGLAAVAGAAFSAWAALGAAAVAALGPVHLSVRGRTSPLRLTRRLKVLAAVWAVLQLAVIGIGILAGVPAPVAAAGALVVPVLVDAACGVLQPLERRAGNRFVRAAAARLARVEPVVVGVTGSYGKTSTKNHIAHLVAGTRTVVATPASFNNRAGLARGVNEHLADGTEVFVAEMGTYGPGEIAELCSWCPPSIAVITAIGPVHLERFGSLERIVQSKAEITARARVVVLNVDDPHLARLADATAADIADDPARVVVRCSATDPRADVCVRALTPAADEDGHGPDGGPAVRVAVWLSGRAVADDVVLPAGLQPSNVAAALAVALHLGVGEADAVARLATLPAVANRLTVGRAPSGVLVIDDTFNSNPAGGRAALDVLARSGATQRRVVVTPGMVELDGIQAQQNRAFAAAASTVATDIVVVGRTNRAALVGGAAPNLPVRVRTRDEAVRWVREQLGAADAVLYENDLPDHYP
jgi:UDP-N-acetylmuramoyl-tripeptide--D-alanyl-D-alanine ligase